LKKKIDLINAYRLLYLTRKLEERIADIYGTDKIKSPIHLSIGQEAPSVGVCLSLGESDVVFGTYRGHALYLAKGGDLNKMVAELYGKFTGCGKGKAGSMHLADKSVGMMGTSAIVSTTIPQAVGYALAQKMKGSTVITVVFFGDGAMEEGVFWESINFAALMKLPVLFVCENNQYAIHTPLSKRVSSNNICERIASFGVPARRIPNNDVIEIYNATNKCIEEMISDGPRFIEIETYRWREHVGPGEDWHFGYRSKEEGDKWKSKDQLLSIGQMITQLDRVRIEKQCDEQIEKALEFAENSPFPKDEELYSDVFK